ncbi:hypothetical protein P3X46_010525 [Hevea brasiliensis]|uniref:Integrase zinc-binding domain-containing protein n=1 Tax=Hevea brasiliensis TaxID=3981 RepID=A0ABQ9MIG8_HEVBR|nr:hypothetical protein P3X46_010525 [Hevea brasiliensis]
MSLISNYLEYGSLLDDPFEAKKIMQKSYRYSVINGWLYKKSFMQPWLKCILPEERAIILIDIHEGLWGNHERAWMITKKAFWQGYFWPTVVDDAKS